MNTIWIERLLAIRDALVSEDYHEAYHQLYMMADDGRDSYTPWDQWESAAEAAKQARLTKAEASKETILDVFMRRNSNRVDFNGNQY